MIKINNRYHAILHINITVCFWKKNKDIIHNQAIIITLNQANNNSVIPFF